MNLYIILPLMAYLILFLGYTKKHKDRCIPQIHNKLIRKNKLSNKELKTWHHKDILEDSLPGISLDKAYNTIIKNKTGRPVIVAVIDMEVAIAHEDLKDNIWKNTKEIPNNGLDDDQNGYIDDVNGWNFLGNNKGENILFANYEYTRILKKFDAVFKDKTIDDVTEMQQQDFLTYKRAQENYEKRKAYALEDKRNGDLLYHGYYLAKKELLPYFPEERYTIKKLDSLKNVFSDNKKFQEHIILLTDCLKYNLTETYINNYKLRADERIDKLLNIDYEAKVITGDDPENLTDTGYGNNVLDANKEMLDHGSRVAGVMAASRANAIGAKGISDHIRIMPLCVSPYGDEHDKDIALAIRYAVDNGAQVINISSGKEFSLFLEWVHDAMKYAADHDVLIINSAGNSSCDLDGVNTFNYPDDSRENDLEIVDNFIKVGASSYQTKTLIHLTSNYGKKRVDIFAPGQKIYTTLPKNEYTYDSGTSLASAITSGVAALIRSYYPKLTAAAVKEIILQSGVAYDIEVEVTQEDGTKTMLPFSELSKSGKVVNAYNALLMAEEMAKE